MRLLFKCLTVNLFLFLEAGPTYKCPGDTTPWRINNHRRLVTCCPPGLQLFINEANDEAVCCPPNKPVSPWSKKCADRSLILASFIGQVPV
jgi:hypothetical protein